jgi:hypothetical protein
MFKRLSVLLAPLAVCILLQSAAQAGVYIQIDIGNDGSYEGWFAIDPEPSNPFIVPVTASAAGGGIFVTSVVTMNETPNASFVGTVDTTVDPSPLAPNPPSGVVRIQALYSDLALPGGDPLSLESAITTVGMISEGNLVVASNTSYVDLIATPGPIFIAPGPPGPPVPPFFAVPGAGGLEAEIPSEEVNPFSDTEHAVVPRPAPIFDLLSDILISFDFTGPVDSILIQTSTTVMNVPEVSSIVAWSFCAALGLLVAYRRKRAA